MKPIAGSRLKLMSLRLLSLLVLLATFGLGQAATPSEISGDEYEVMSSALQHLVDQRELYDRIAVDANTKSSVKSDIHESLSDFLNSEDNVEGVPKEALKMFRTELQPETIRDWEKKNTNSYRLSNNFRLRARITVLRSRDWNDLGKEIAVERIGGGPGPFDKKYPDANTTSLAEASRAGFNRNRTQAVIYVECDRASWRAFYVLLAKLNGAWQVRQAITVWVE